MITTIMGVDPGTNGASVTLNKFGAKWQLTRCFRLGSEERVVAAHFRREVAVASEFVAYMEKVGGWAGQAARSSFTFGRSYGFTRGVLVATGVPIVDVLPQKWMVAMGLPPMKGQKALHRQAMREMAGQLQNEVTATNWNSAAILIALYALGQEGGQLG